MQTVLDIIRHYSGAGKEDKDMEHKCEGVEAWDRIVKDNDGEWILSLDCNCCTKTIKFCPFCGEELDHWEWKMKKEKNGGEKT